MLNENDTMNIEKRRHRKNDGKEEQVKTKPKANSSVDRYEQRQSITQKPKNTLCHLPIVVAVTIYEPCRSNSACSEVCQFVRAINT